MGNPNTLAAPFLHIWTYLDKSMTDKTGCDDAPGCKIHHKALAGDILASS